MSVTAAIALTANTVLTGAAAFAQMRQGRKMMKEAMEGIRDYERQGLENIFKDIEVSTKAQDMQREEVARTTSTAIDAMSKAGARGVIGGVSSVAEYNRKALSEISAQLDSKFKEREMMIAQDEARIRQMRERREELDLEGYANLYGTGAAERSAGFRGLVQTGSSFAGAVSDSFEGVDLFGKSKNGNGANTNEEV